MSSNSGANARVSIPNSVKKTIQNIKEIGVNHSDEDVYAMLKECSMDPNETVQRLLFLDTFHEVKRKKDKKKENVNGLNGRVLDDVRRKVTNQVRGGRGGRGSYSSQYGLYDAGNGTKAVVRKENGFVDRGSSIQSPAGPALPLLKELDSRTSKKMEKISPATVKGLNELSSDGVIVGDDKKNSANVDTVLQKADANADPIRTELTLSESDGSTEYPPFAFKPLLNSKKTCIPQIPNGVVAIECVANSLQIGAGTENSALAEAELGSSSELIVQNLVKNQHVIEENSELTDILVSEELSAALINEKSVAADSLVKSLAPAKVIEDTTSKLEKLKFPEGQHVILPDHIQVSDAVKNVLSFGSLGSCFSVGLNNIVNSDSNGNSNQASNLVEDGRSNEASEESVDDEIAKKHDSCDEDTPSSADEENYCDPPPAPQVEFKTPIENKDPALEVDQLKQETFPGAIPQHAIIQTPTYNLSYMPPLLGSSQIPLEAHDYQHQVHLSNYMNGNAVAMSTSGPTPPPAQSPGSVPSSVVVSVQPVPLIRQQYPPNFIPYGHYLSPFLMPPALQFVGHGAFPPLLPNGNMYMAPAATPTMKPSPQYKLGTNTTNQQTPFPIPSGPYAVMNSPQVGVSNANDNLVTSMLKENSIYLGQPNSANMPITPFFNLPHPQAQHIAHTPFPAMYHPALQTVSAPLLQPGQPMPASVDSVGLPQPPPPPPNGFQQPPQRHQMSWNNTY